MSHPCSGHACDHCTTCDVLGICCASIPPTNPRTITSRSDTGSLTDLRTALTTDIQSGRTTTSNLRNLVTRPSLPVPAGVAGRQAQNDRQALPPAAIEPVDQSLWSHGQTGQLEPVRLGDKEASR